MGEQSGQAGTTEQKYLPLFRKYRPQAFSDIVGQENLVKALSNAIELNRIASAYLFCGPRGTGKTSTARIFAKSLNCEHGPTLTPCQKCASCVDITNASGLDVIEIDAASNRGIQDAKELISKVQYAPINGKYKIFIIDEVHMLSNDAFNALLKTFEEPPENVIFILATTEPHKVLETIVSRCQRFDLKRISTDDIIKRLREISELENIKITDDALFTIAKNVSGGLRDSLALLDQVSVLGLKDTIQKEMIEELLGKVNFDTLLNLLENIVNSDVENSLRAINEIYQKGNEPRNLAENLLEFLRNVILVLSSNNSGKNINNIYENISNFTTFILEDIEKLISKNFPQKKVENILNTLIDYYKEIKISSNPYLWMELAVIAACKGMQEGGFEAQTKQNMAINPINKPEYTEKPLQAQKERAGVQTSQAQNDIQEIESKKTEPEKVEIQNIETEKAPAQDAIYQNTASQDIVSQGTISQGAAGECDNLTANSSQSAKQPSEIWQEIVSSITSTPARAFYLGVAKLVKIENNKITLGFLHDNAILQAKSESKFAQLNSAKMAKYPDYEIEFIKITSDTKVINVAQKPKPSFEQSSAPVSSPFETSENRIEPVSFENKSSEMPHSGAPSDDNTVLEDNSNKNNEQYRQRRQQYSAKVEEMLEEFNGRLIQ